MFNLSAIKKYYCYNTNLDLNLTKETLVFLEFLKLNPYYYQLTYIFFFLVIHLHRSRKTVLTKLGWFSLPDFLYLIRSTYKINKMYVLIN